MNCPKCDSNAWSRMGTLVECCLCGYRQDELYNFHYFNKAKYLK